MTTRTPLFAALGAVTLAGCTPALVEYPRERIPFHEPDVIFADVERPEVEEGGSEDALETPSDPQVDGPVGEVERPTDPLAEFDPGYTEPDTSQCGDVTSQSGWCASLRDEPGVGAVVGFIGLDDGAVCDVLFAEVGASTLTATSLAVQGTQTAWCDGANVVHTVDLATGAITTSTSTASACAAMTEMQGGLVVLPQNMGRDLVWYPGVAALLDGDGISWPVRPWASRIAADSSTIYAATHQTDTIERWEPSGIALEPLELDHSGFLYGMDTVDGDLLVILDDSRDLRLFDAVTGDTVDLIPLSGNWSGLACFPSP